MSRGVTARMGEPDHAQAQFVENTDKVQVRSERFCTLHGNEKSDLAGGTRCLNFPIAFADDNAPASFRLSVEARDLAEGDRQCLLRKVTVLDKNGGTDDRDVAGFQLGQELCGEDVRVSAFLKELHGQIEVQIN